MPRPLPTGITRDRIGYRVFVRVQGELRSRRFKADTSLLTMERWRLEQRASMPPKPDAGTLAADVEAYLLLKKGMPTYDTRAAMMADWLVALGPKRERTTISSLEISQALANWQRTRNYAPSSLNHFRTALSDFYNRMDPTAPNPVKAVPKAREADLKPRGVRYRLIRAILGAMPKSKARAVLSVIAYTGMPPAVIRALKPEHVLWAESAVVMPSRRKGAGTVTRRRALTRQGVAALKRFAAADAWGGVCNTTTEKVMRRAIVRVRKRHPSWSIPADMVVYDMRHSYAEAVYRAVRTIAVTAGLLGHLDHRTTMRYIAGAVDEVERAAVDVVSRNLR